MIKLEKVKPGDRLMDIHRTTMGNTTMRQWGLWYVLVVEVDLPGNRALVKWNEVNRAEWWPRRRVERLYTKPTKAYRDQVESQISRPTSRLDDNPTWCQCGQPAEPGTCPFDEDVHDKVTVCDCCTNCRNECAQDI